MANSTEYGLFQLIDKKLLNPNLVVAQVPDSGLLISGVQIDNAMHNTMIDNMLNLFCRETINFQEAVQLSSTTRNQPLDENGRSIPIKPAAPYTVQYPIHGSGNAWGANWLMRQRMSVLDLARTLARIFRGDVQWVTDHILGALFSNASWNIQDPIYGSLTMQGLANGDAVTYYKLGSNGTATDNHYFAQVASIADATNPFPTIRQMLYEHPENGGEYIAFVSSSILPQIQGLAEFRSAQLNPHVRQGANTAILTDRINIPLPWGATLRGATDSGFWIVEWPQIPAGYGAAIMSQGPRPLARRLFPEAGLRGFGPQGERDSWPYLEEQWSRWEGYSAYNRVGAVVFRIGNASFAVPTGYSEPMP